MTTAMNLDSGPTMIRVLLLDDHAVVRDGYRRWIGSEPDMEVVAEAATSAQACEALRHHEVDLAVVDLSLKGDSGMEAIRRLRERDERLRILVFTMHDQPTFMLQAMRLGVQGYLTKDCDPEAVIGALRRIAAGQRVFNAEVAQASLNQVDAGLDPFSHLTPREFEVLRLATSGLDHEAIARSLHISEKTVYNTMSRVRQKLDERNDFRLMRLATERGLTGP
jgi:DNA-binding NarL/FixJ family response regulator